MEKLQKTEETLLKFLLIGDVGSGKTSIINRYTDDTFTSHHLVTIGIDFKIKKVELNGMKFKLQIWDTAGQERFRTVTSALYRKTSGIMLVCDLSKYDSIATLEVWLKEIKKYCSEDTVIVLVGSKDDLNVLAPLDILKVFANDHGIPFISTSSKTGNNINEAFKTLLSNYILISSNDFGKEKNNEYDKNLRVSVQQPQKKKGC